MSEETRIMCPKESNSFKTAWVVLMAAPLAIAWMLLFGLLVATYGLATADKFIKHWGNFIDDDGTDSTVVPPSR